MVLKVRINIKDRQKEDRGNQVHLIHSRVQKNLPKNFSTSFHIWCNLIYRKIIDIIYLIKLKFTIKIIIKITITPKDRILSIKEPLLMNYHWCKRTNLKPVILKIDILNRIKWSIIHTISRIIIRMH